jgi:putative membrane protein
LKKLLLVSAACVFASAAAIADPADQPGHQSPAPGTSNDSMSAVKDTAGHVVGDASAEMTTSLKGFVAAAATSDMYEVAAGKIAQDRSQNPKVRMFAEKMVKAHTETTDKLKALLASGHGDVTPPMHLDDRRQGMIDELRGAKDTDFDSRYIAQQIDAHKEALILLKGYAKDGDVTSIRHFAAQTAPVVRSHLTMAESIEKQLNR